MTVSILKLWILNVLLAMEPNTPWKGTYESTAEAFAKYAVQMPLFQGDEDGRKTASIFVSVAWFEGHFKPDAQGDCDKTDPKTGMCAAGRPHSFCTFQINESNLKSFDVTKDQLLSDIDTCTRVAASIMKRSFSVCKDRPLEDRLNWYAAGGGDCRANVPKGRHRMNKGKWVYDRFPLAAQPIAKVENPALLPHL